MRTGTSCGGKAEKGMAVSMLRDLECLQVGCLSPFFFRYFFTTEPKWSNQKYPQRWEVRNVVIDKNLTTNLIFSPEYFQNHG